MGIAEQVYKVKSPSKTISADANRDSHVRKLKGGETASPINPEEGRSCKRKTKNEFSQSEQMKGAEKYACCMAPDTPLRSVNYLRNTRKITPRSGNIKIMKPSPA